MKNQVVKIVIAEKFHILARKMRQRDFKARHPVLAASPKKRQRRVYGGGFEAERSRCPMADATRHR